MTQKYPRLLHILYFSLVLLCTSASYADGVAIRKELVDGLKEIPFSEVADVKKFVDEHRFVEGFILDESGLVNKNFAPLKLYEAEISSQDQRTNVLVIRLTGSLYCGTHGCSTLVFRKVDENYELISSISSNDLYYQSCRANVYFITRDSNDLIRWDLEKTTPDHAQTKRYDHAKKIPACS